MPTLDDLKKRIKSVKSTQKITKAMKMVAAAKLKKAQESAEKGRPYSEKMQNIILNLIQSITETDNAPKLLIGTGQDKTYLCVVMTADRGLCGGFNSNICKLAKNYFKKFLKEGKELKIITVGSKGHDQIKAEHTVISSASCTTNGLAPIVKVIQDSIGIESGLMNTIHSYTNDQVILDNMHDDVRRARSGAISMIPTKTGAASAVGLVIPELKGKLDGVAIRVPTSNVSLVDLTITTTRMTDKDEVNALMKKAAENNLKGVLVYNKEPLVSIDFNHTSGSSYFDSTLTKVSADGKLVKVFGWYDNEWGFSCRMIDTAIAMMKA